MQPVSVRYQVSKPILVGKEKEYVRDALESGWISSSGVYISRFEQAVSSFLRLEEGIAVCNGTVALHLACLGMGVKPGMDVVVPSLTYVATANAVAYCGGKPIFADCDLHTWNVTRESIEAAWTPRTVGVLLVHLYGLPCPAQEIQGLCRERGVWLIEDCAESFGAQIEGRTAGSFGDAATFSFYGNKIVSTGEGGMVFVRDPARREVVMLLKGQGMDLNRRYWHPIVGYNYRMSNLTAAIGLGQVEMADYHLAERRRIASRYLKNLGVLQREGLVRLPVEPQGYLNVYWLFGLVLQSREPNLRERVQEILLHSYGIETRPFFVPMHCLPMYDSGQHLAHSEFLADRGFSLPTYSGLPDNAVDEISEIAAAIIRREVKR